MDSSEHGRTRTTKGTGVRKNEELFQAFLADTTFVSTAQHDYEHMGVEMPVGGDGLRIREDRKK